MCFKKDHYYIASAYGDIATRVIAEQINAIGYTFIKFIHSKSIPFRWRIYPSTFPAWKYLLFIHI